MRTALPSQDGDVTARGKSDAANSPTKLHIFFGYVYV